MKKYFINVLIIYMFLLICMSCNKSSDYYYRGFLDSAELARPGRTDSLSILPGHNRALIRFKVAPDRRVNNIRVSYNTSLSAVLESVFIPVSLADYGNYKQVELVDLPEATLIVNTVTFTSLGDSSNRSEITGAVYGSRYISTLNNRIVSGITTENGIRTINFMAERGLPLDRRIFTPMQRTEIQYPTSATDSVIIPISPYDLRVALPGLISAGSLRFRTVYKPVELAIDEFYGPWTTRFF